MGNYIPIFTIPDKISLFRPRRISFPGFITDLLNGINFRIQVLRPDGRKETVLSAGVGALEEVGSMLEMVGLVVVRAA